MEGNIGKTEKRIRVGVGLLFLGIVSFSLLPGWGLILGLLLGAIGVVTGLVGHCPLWNILGSIRVTIPMQNITKRPRPIEETGIRIARFHEPALVPVRINHHE